MTNDKLLTREELDGLEKLIDTARPVFDNMSDHVSGEDLIGIYLSRNNAYRLIEAVRRVDKVCSCGIQTGQNAGYRFCPWCGRKRK